MQPAIEAVEAVEVTMEVHRQRCQACNSIEVKNILAREATVPTVIYVRCARCDALVARYELSDYYHHGKGIDSFLRSRNEPSMESGRRVLKEFERARTRAEKGYERVLHELERQGKPV